MKPRVRASWQQQGLPGRSWNYSKTAMAKDAQMKPRGVGESAFSPPPACQAQPAPPTGQTQPVGKGAWEL